MWWCVQSIINYILVQKYVWFLQLDISVNLFTHLITYEPTLVFVFFMPSVPIRLPRY